MTGSTDLAPDRTPSGSDAASERPWLYVFGTSSGEAVKVGLVPTEARLVPRLHEIARRYCRSDLRMLASAPIEDIAPAEAEHVEATVRLWMSHCDDLSLDSRADWLIVEQHPDDGWQELLDSAVEAVMEFAS